MEITPWNGQIGTVCMPLYSNIPDGKSGWKLVKCSVCGRECWEMPEHEDLVKIGMKVACTMCALSGG